MKNSFFLIQTLIAVMLSVHLGFAAEPPIEKAACCAKEIAATTPLPDRSLYQLDSTWTNDTAIPLKLVSLKGRVQVMTMFFANCEYACPILVHDMKRIEAALPENIRTNIGFVLLSFDSERDSPEVLASYRRTHGLAANWSLLSGESNDVLELAALLGVKFKKDQRGQFAHSNVITLLDQHGQIITQQIGLNRDPASIVAEMAKLLPIREPSTQQTSHEH